MNYQLEDKFYPSGDVNLRIPKMSRLTEKQASVEKELSRIVQSPSRADSLYDQIKATQEGKILCVDLARYLEPRYRKNKAEFTPATFNPSMCYIVDRLERKIRSLNETGKKKLLILAGGPGSGKTTCVRGILTDHVKEADLVFDGTLTRFEADLQLISTAVKYGWKVDLFFIYRPYRDVVIGMLKRTQITGRYVGIGRNKDMSRMHLESMLCFEQALKQFENERQVSFFVVNISGEKARFIDPKQFVKQQSQQDRSEETILKIEREAKRLFLNEHNGDAQTIALCENGTRIPGGKREHNHLFWNQCRL